MQCVGATPAHSFPYRSPGNPHNEAHIYSPLPSFLLRPTTGSAATAPLPRTASPPRLLPAALAVRDTSTQQPSFLSLQGYRNVTVPRNSDGREIPKSALLGLESLGKPRHLVVEHRLTHQLIMESRHVGEYPPPPGLVGRDAGGGIVTRVAKQHLTLARARGCRGAGPAALIAQLLVQQFSLAYQPKCAQGG